MKKFLLKLSLFGLPLITLILFTNVYVDSGFLFRKKVKNAEIASIIVSGNNVGIQQIPSDWGTLQTEIVQEGKEQNCKPKDVVVFGTSRSSEISSELFPGKTFFNCIIPGGTINDIIALYGLYKSNNLLPNYLIINIDFCTFHARKATMINDETEYLTDSLSPIPIRNDLYNEFYLGINYLGIKNENQKVNNSSPKQNFIKDIVKIGGLLDLDYFQTNLKSSRKPMIIKTKKEHLKSYFVIRNDGGYSLAQQSNIKSTEIIEQSKKFIAIHKNKFFISHDTGTIYFDYLKKLLIGIQNDGIIPLIYISPVNPIVYDNITSQNSVAIEDKIRKYCSDYHIICIGSFNPHRYGYNNTRNYFIDAYHPVKMVVNNVFYAHRKELDSIGIRLNFSQY